MLHVKETKLFLPQKGTPQEIRECYQFPPMGRNLSITFKFYRMKKQFMYALLIGALVVPTTGTLTSCKDYDDDISSLQSQIDKAGLKSDIEALQTQLQNASAAATAAKTTAESALAKAEAAATADAVAAVKATADKAAADVATAIANAAAAQSSADAAATTASTAQAAADKAIADAASAAATALAAQGTADKASTDVADALRRIGTLEQNSVTADQLETQLSDLKKSLLGEGGENESIATLTAKVDAYKGAVNELYSAVTSVELVESYAGFSGITDNWGSNSSQGGNLAYLGNPLTVDMIHGLITEDSRFGDEVAGVSGVVEYKKGTDVASNDDASIIVRVNPVNADLTKGTKIVLMDSKGNSLEKIVKVGEPKRFDKLITTRASQGKTGLWQLPLSVADGVSQEKFDEEIKVIDEHGNENTILYAVAINNTVDSKAEAAADRYVVSSYDVQPIYKEFAPGNDFTFEVAGKQVNALKNRYGLSDYQELKWNSYGPAAAPIMEDDGDIHKNVTAAIDDNRSGNNLIQVQVGKAFNVAKVVGLLNGEAVPADHYYVVLDEKNAVESGVSEINAWKSYKIDGLNTVVSGADPLALTIQSESANGDVIGFRVYAVNKDGKLLDPDGKAFYVQVGNFITGEVFANLDCVKGWTEAKPFTKQADVTYGPWVAKDKNNIMGETYTIPDSWVKYLDKDGNATSVVADITQVQFPVNPSVIKDGATITFTSKLTKAGVEVGTVTATITKVLPTTFPAEITFRPTQEYAPGKFKAFLVPVNGWETTSTSVEGTVDLNNIFYDLSDNITFTIAKAAKQGNKDVDVTAPATAANHHLVSIGKGYIDSETEHTVTAVYNYGNISCKPDENGNLVTEPYTISYGKNLSVIFACWAKANTYQWATNKQPKVMWNYAGTAVTGKTLADVKVTNSYDPTRFSGTFAALLAKPYFDVVAGSAHLKVDGQIDPYFTVAIAADGALTFTPSQTENAPTQDHVEQLVFQVKDAYGHVIDQSFDVLIQKPAN